MPFDKPLAALVLDRTLDQINAALGDDEIDAIDALHVLSQVLKPPPTMARMNALSAELLRKGHSLARHGPQIGRQELVDRLSTGIVSGAFSPADKGYATSFTSALTYNLSRINALNVLKAAYRATVEHLRPLITAFDDAVAVVRTTAKGPDYGAVVKVATGARAKLLKACGLLTVEAMKGDPDCRLMPVATRAAGKPSDTDRGIDLIEFLDAVGLVVEHECTVGRGVRARDLAAAKSIVNPRYAQGKPGSVWDVDQLMDMNPIERTFSKFNPPQKAFVLDANLDEWEMPQHFPDNGAPGWRS